MICNWLLLTLMLNVLTNGCSRSASRKTASSTFFGKDGTPGRRPSVSTERATGPRRIARSKGINSTRDVTKGTGV